MQRSPRGLVTLRRLVVAGLTALAPGLALAAPGPSLGVRSRVERTGAARTAASAAIELTWPLGEARPPAAARPEPHTRQARSEEGAPLPEESLAAAAGRGAESPAPERPSIVITPELARGALRAAARAARSGESWTRLADLAGRTRTSAALPEVRLSGGRTTDESLRLAPTADDPTRYTSTGEARLFFEVRLTWRLDRLVFAGEELGVERLRGAWVAARAALARQVLAALVAWQRAALRSADPDADDAVRAEALVAAVEAEITLDLLTDGWFTGRVRSVTAEADPPRR